MTLNIVYAVGLLHVFQLESLYFTFCVVPVTMWKKINDKINVAGYNLHRYIDTGTWADTSVLNTGCETGLIFEIIACMECNLLLHHSQTE